MKVVTDNKKFWKNVKPFLSDKGKCSSKISLVEKDEIISSDTDVANSFSNFFDNAVKSLKINGYHTNDMDISAYNDPVEIAIAKFQIHPSIKAIRDNISLEDQFEFSEIGLDEILKEIDKLDIKKKGTCNNIPTNKLKEVSDIIGPILSGIWNKEIIDQKNFSINLKLADVTPIFKKEDKTNVKNYRPVSVLPTVSKIFERVLQKQISIYIKKVNFYLNIYVAIGKVLAHRLLWFF